MFSLCHVALAIPLALAADPGPPAAADEFAAGVRPLLVKYCVTCHAAKEPKGDLDLERFATLDRVRKDLKPWPGVADAVENGEMPPKKALQPNDAERRRVVAWVRGVLAAEARARAGDPGRVVVRRLSNAEFENTLRDLTGLDLHPAHDFPADGAAGEGFTNVGDALVTSPTLLTRYLAAAKEVAAHAVLLPEDFRFSSSKTARDWTDEAVAELKAFYAPFAPDGRLPIQPYLAAAVAYREDLLAGRISPDAVSAKAKVNAKYFKALWRALTDPTPSFPLDRIRTAWRSAKPADVPALADEIAAWQKSAWRTVKIGSYGGGYLARQQPIEPAALLGAVGGLAAGSVAGFDDFRRVFPLFVCYPHVIPTDEVVCLKLYHREDEPLARLFLDDEQRQRLDRLWANLTHVSRWPVTERDNLPLFIGFVTQDGGPKAVAYFESLREPFRARAEAFRNAADASVPKQLDALVDFAAKAYRRPLAEAESHGLRLLYNSLRLKELPHDEAFRTTLARVLVSPAFLFRVEQSPPGPDAKSVSDWELASRLSYFLWATSPDDELRRLAAAGALHDPPVLAGQVSRMLKDPRVRGLAVEFGTRWLHVRDIGANREKNEKLFPQFDRTLRDALFEEAALVFQDLFQADRAVSDLLDSDHTFLNETLARHYGIPGVSGTQWRRVSGVKKFGRGGLLGLGAVLATQAGASRTSPVLRGNWVSEVLLGEKLPKPPAGVPQLPEEEAGAKATVREMVARHTRAAECAVCHQRIDPFGFALEKYDPVGRFRDRDLAGRPVDARVELRDGTAFDGLDGLRGYLLGPRAADVEKQFCRKLLGYALGRAVTLSDQPLLDEIRNEMKANGHRASAAVQAVVRSRQFRYHRGIDATKDE